MKSIKAWTIILFIGVLLIGCSSPGERNSNTDESNESITVYTTVYPLQYIVEEIGGDTVTANSVFPPGVDGHMYEPTSKEMTDFAASDAFIYIGAGMEGFADSVSEALESEDVALIEMGQHEELFQKGNHENSEHVHESEQTIEIQGLAEHYHTGDRFELTANLHIDSEYDHWHWFTLDPDEDDWQVVDDLHDNAYEGEAVISEQQIKAVLYDDDHGVIAESAPVTITIDDHGHDHGHEHHEQEEHGNEHEDHAHEEYSHDHHDEQEDSEHDHHHTEHKDSDEYYAIKVDGLAAHYHTGDQITLTASYEDGSDEDHWHWYTLVPGSEEWEVARGQHHDTYEGEADLSGLQIKAVLYGDDHEVIAESESKTIIIDDHTDHDPHIWVDPLRMIDLAEIIKDELIALNPDSAGLYQDNLAVLKDNLTELNQRFMELLSQKENKSIIVPHSAFGYWEERYGVQQITISGLSSSEEPSQKDLVAVMEAAEEFDLEYILFEQNSDNRLSRIVQDEIGAQALTIHNLEVRTEEDIENEEDYISLMEYNLEILDQVTK